MRETRGEWLGEVGASIGGRLYKVSQFIQGILLELAANDSISFHFCTKKISLHKLGPNHWQSVTAKGQFINTTARLCHPCLLLI